MDVCYQILRIRQHNKPSNSPPQLILNELYDEKGKFERVELEREGQCREQPKE